MIPLDSIVGTVDRRRGDFDRAFRPSPSTRGRWERIAEARKRGEAMPPIDVFRIGDLHFVHDGHHRVSVARAMGDKDINAHVIEVRTKLGAEPRAADARPAAEGHERVFHERVPLPPRPRERIQLSDEWRYAQLATLVESWGYRATLEREQLLSAPEMARAVVPRGVRADRRGAARGGPRRRRHRDRALPAHRHAALPAAADATTGPTTSLERLLGEVKPPSRGRGRHDDPPDPQGDAMSRRHVPFHVPQPLQTQLQSHSRSGIIIRVSGVRVPPPASEEPANRAVFALLGREGHAE